MYDDPCDCDRPPVPTLFQSCLVLAGVALLAALAAPALILLAAAGYFDEEK